MRLSRDSRFNDVAFVKLKDESFVADQRRAGQIAAQTLSLLKRLVKERTTKSLLELDAMAEEYIRGQGAIPTFKDYGIPPFPNSVCVSVNNQLVHGVCTDYVLQEGDLVSFDLGATINGAVADSALTCVYGQANSEQEHLIKTTEECLQRAIATVKVGSRLGEIGHAIHKCAKHAGYNVFVNYGGHFICRNEATKDAIPHAQPFVANRAEPQEGIRIQEGMTLAIEPLLTRGFTDTWVGSDGWTVYGKGPSCHFEHTIFVHQDRVEIITDRTPYET